MREIEIKNWGKIEEKLEAEFPEIKKETEEFETEILESLKKEESEEEDVIFYPHLNYKDDYTTIIILAGGVLACEVLISKTNSEKERFLIMFTTLFKNKNFPLYSKSMQVSDFNIFRELESFFEKYKDKNGNEITKEEEEEILKYIVDNIQKHNKKYEIIFLDKPLTLIKLISELKKLLARPVNHFLVNTSEKRKINEKMKFSEFDIFKKYLPKNENDFKNFYEKKSSYKSTTDKLYAFSFPKSYSIIEFEETFSDHKAKVVFEIDVYHKDNKYKDDELKLRIVDYNSESNESRIFYRFAEVYSKNKEAKEIKKEKIYFDKIKRNHSLSKKMNDSNYPIQLKNNDNDEVYTKREENHLPKKSIIKKIFIPVVQIETKRKNFQY